MEKENVNNCEAKEVQTKSAADLKAFKALFAAIAIYGVYHMYSRRQYSI